MSESNSDLETHSHSSSDDERIDTPQEEVSFGFGNLRIPDKLDDSDDYDVLERGEDIELEIIIFSKGKQVDKLHHRMFSSAAVENLKQWIEDELGIPLENQKLYTKMPVENIRDIPNPLSLSDIEGISSKQLNILYINYN